VSRSLKSPSISRNTRKWQRRLENPLSRGEDETAITDLDEVVDAAVASVQSEQESDANRER
jgi:hypothetical protein